jgi:hypothetical protein
MLSLLMTTTIKMIIINDEDDKEGNNNHNNNNAESRDSVVIIVTKLHCTRSGVRIAVETREFFLLQNVQTGCGAHAEFEADNCPPSNAEVKNDWCYTSTQVSTAILRKSEEILMEEIKHLGALSQVYAIHIEIIIP